MENELIQPVNKNVNVPKAVINQKYLYLIIVISLVLSCISLILYKENIKTNGRLQLELNTISTEMNEIKESNLVLTKNKENSDQLAKRLESIEMNSYFDRMQHRIESGVVTDNFIVEKMFITSIPPQVDGGVGLLNTTIDLDTQPGGKSEYTGQGKFSVTDRELKAMILDILDMISERYNGGIDLLFKDKGLIYWNKGIHNVTIKNYEIGTYSDGVFKLKGE